MKLRYGFNEIDGWAAFAMGEHRAQIRRRLRLMGTQVIRVFVFDKPVPDPFKEWHWFAAVLQAVLDAGAKPMVTFAKFHPPFDNPANIRDFVAPLLRDRLGLPRAVGRRGGEGLVLVRLERAEQSGYRRRCHLRAVSPHLRGGGRGCPGAAGAASRRPQGQARRARPSTARNGRSGWTGLPSSSPTSTTGCSASSTGTCTRTGGRRCRARPSNVKLWGAPDAPNGAVFEALAMAQTPQYEARARGVARLLHGRDILNVCGELNTVAHHEHAVHPWPQSERVRGGVLCLRAHPPDPRRRGPGDAVDGDIQAARLGRP